MFICGLSDGLFVFVPRLDLYVGGGEGGEGIDECRSQTGVCQQGNVEVDGRAAHFVAVGKLGRREVLGKVDYEVDFLVVEQLHDLGLALGLGGPVCADGWYAVLVEEPAGAFGGVNGESVVVVGIGVNVFTENYPEDIKDKAGSLLPGALTRNELAAEITKELLGFSKNLNAPELMEEYRRKSMVIGEEIYWMEKEIRKEGRAIGINESGNLIVETKEGKVILSAGEISVRKSC